VITRVRIEAKGRTEQEVKDNLVEQARQISANHGRHWEIEGEDVQAAKDGWWGYLTIKRKES
jgi:hypothetical protein